MPLTKSFKVFVAITIFCAGIYGVAYVFAFEAYRKLVAWPFYDPVYAGLLGVTYFALAAGAALVLSSKTWEHARSLVLVFIIWLGLVSLFSVWALVRIQVPPSTRNGMVMDTLLTTVLALGYVYFYWRQEQRGGQEKRT
jgi:hypothetical protein